MDYPVPYNTELEENLLGGLILAPDTFHVVSNILSHGEEAFYNSKHKAIYNAIESTILQNKPLDVRLLYLEVAKLHSGVTQSDMMSLLSNAVTGELNEYYAKELANVYTRRTIQLSCKKTLDSINSNEDTDIILGNLEKDVFISNSIGNEIVAEDISDVANKWYEKVKAGGDDASNRVYSGWKDLDKYLAIMPGMHIIIGARTSMGKTSFAINLATNIALQGKRPFLFTMEQTKESVATCYVCQIADIDRYSAMTNQLNERQLNAIERTKHIWGAKSVSNMGIADRSWSAQQIRHKIIIEKNKRPVDIVIIDFLHNMKPPRGMSTEGHEWLRVTTKELEEIAIELNTPIITLAQLSRKVEGRDDKRPIIVDIREAGEDNADAILFIYRDEYYNPDTTEEPGVAEIIIAKNRHGRTGTIKLMFVNHSTAFKDRANNNPEKVSWTTRYDD